VWKTRKRMRSCRQRVARHASLLLSSAIVFPPFSSSTPVPLLPSNASPPSPPCVQMRERKQRNGEQGCGTRQGRHSSSLHPSAFSLRKLTALLCIQLVCHGISAAAGRSSRLLQRSAGSSTVARCACAAFHRLVHSVHDAESPLACGCSATSASARCPSCILSC
jgi:hypothetical protein